MRWLDGIIDSVKINLGKLWKMVTDVGEWAGAGRGGTGILQSKELDMTGQLNNSSLICINIITFTSFKLRIQMN